MSNGLLFNNAAIQMSVCFLKTNIKLIQKNVILIYYHIITTIMLIMFALPS